MMGTLAAVLAGKKIRTFKDLFKATVTGDIEDVDGVLKITRINVDYLLKVPEEKREDALEAMDNYLQLCPGAQSVIGCIEINHELTMEAIQA
jgi:organic hydroperoxide reductase OsmC/OhrA